MKMSMDMLKSLAAEYRARGSETRDEFCARRGVSQRNLRDALAGGIKEARSFGVARSKPLSKTLPKSAAKSLKKPQKLKKEIDGAMDVTADTKVRASFTAPSMSRAEASSEVSGFDVEGILSRLVERSEALSRENRELRAALLGVTTKYEKILMLFKRAQDLDATTLNWTPSPKL